MPASLILTFIAHDRPGLVKTISETIAGAGGSWLESRLARLAGEFAGIVLVSLPEDKIAALTTALRGLEQDGLRVTVERGNVLAAAARYRGFDLSLVGQDRPGIVRDVTQALSQLGVNIEEFSSFIEKAAFTGETMFRAVARLSAPDNITDESLKKILERLADEMMVDLTETDPQIA